MADHPTALILKEKGPLLSGDLANELVKRGIAHSSNSARKVIQRARDNRVISSTAPVTFDKSYLCYLEKQRKDKYPKAIREVLQLRPPLQRAFKVMLANKGYITHGQLAKSAGCTDHASMQVNRRLTPEKLIEQATQLELLEPLIGHPNVFRIGPLFGRPEIQRNSFLKRLEIDDLLLEGACEWLQHCYLLAPKAREVRSSHLAASVFNQYWWDIHGPIFIGSRRDREDSRFLVCDFIGYRQVTLPDAQSFVERVNDVNARWRSIQLVPIVIGERFSSEAWRHLRSSGVAAVTISDVFGKQISQLLRLFEDALNAKEAEDISLAKLSEFLQKSDTDELSQGIIANMKGAIFELLVALYYKNIGFDVTLQKVIRRSDDNVQFEIDVVAVRSSKHAILAECKGRTKNAVEHREEIDRHFKDRLHTATSEFGWDVTSLYERVDAVFISTGTVPPEIRPQRRFREKGINHLVYDRDEFLKLLDDATQSDLKQLVNRFF